MTVDEGLKCSTARLTHSGTGWRSRAPRKLITLPGKNCTGRNYDEGLDVVIPFLEQTIDEGTELGTPHTDIKTEDQWRSKKRTIDIDAAEAVLGAYLMTYPSKTNVSMPDKLVGLSAQIQSQTGDANDAEVGSVAGYGNYSINLDLRADATASATIIPEVVAEIRQFYGANINCTHYIFFLRNPVTSADVLSHEGRASRYSGARLAEV